MSAVKTFLLTILLVLFCAPALQSAERELPVPNTVSKEAQELISQDPFPFWNFHPKNTQEWKDFVDAAAEAAKAGLPEMIKNLEVTVTASTMAGVPVYTITPKYIPEVNKDRILLNFHGGGYVLNPGEAGISEAALMSGIGAFKVVCVDYRMAPDFPYPAAMEDAMAVYRELLKTYPADKIGVFGSSTGGAMTLALTMMAKDDGIPMPGALAPGTPWSDLTKTGDTYFTNEGVDNVLVSYDGWLGDAAKLYAGDHDMQHPYLSPVYGDVVGFPPTLLTSGTRDLFLSNTVRMHQKLREAGVDADLIVFEGLSHIHYLMIPTAPETIFHFRELARFFNKNLK